MPIALINGRAQRCQMGKAVLLGNGMLGIVQRNLRAENSIVSLLGKTRQVWAQQGARLYIADLVGLEQILRLFFEMVQMRSRR